MSKKLILSLFVSTLVLPSFFINDVNAYPKPPRGPEMGAPQMEGNPPCCPGNPPSDAMMQKMRDPKFMEMMQPIREANRALFSALEIGNIKDIQAAAKELATRMSKVSDPEIKKMLSNAIHLATLMSTGSPTYRELLATYALLKSETAPFHPNKRQYGNRFPRLMVDTNTYNAIISADEQMQILVNSLVTDSESALNTKIDTLMNTLKTVKTPQLQDYITPLLTTLTDMKKAKTVMAKITYKQLVIGRVSRLVMITKEK